MDELTIVPGLPDCKIAFLNKFFPQTNKLLTMKLPADSPNTVTLLGLPPKFEMLDCTHSKAEIQSYKP